jgi:hypothetical protein
MFCTIACPCGGSKWVNLGFSSAKHCGITVFFFLQAEMLCSSTTCSGNGEEGYNFFFLFFFFCAPSQSSLAEGLAGVFSHQNH